MMMTSNPPKTLFFFAELIYIINNKNCIIIKMKFSTIDRMYQKQLIYL